MGLIRSIKKAGRQVGDLTEKGFRETKRLLRDPAVQVVGGFLIGGPVGAATALTLGSVEGGVRQGKKVDALDAQARTRAAESVRKAAESAKLEVRTRLSERRRRSRFSTVLTGGQGALNSPITPNLKSLLGE